VTKTIQEVRQVLHATELNDHYTGVVSSSPDLYHLTVSQLAAYPAGHFNGGWVYVYSGTGKGQESQIVTHDTGGALTISGFSSAVSPGESMVEVHRKYSVSTVLKAMRRAYSELSKRTFFLKYDNSLTYSSSETDYEIPDGFVFIHDITFEGESIGKENWFILQGQNKIRILSGSEDQAIEILGSTCPAELSLDDITADESECLIDYEYLVFKSMAILLRSEAGGAATDADANTQRSTLYEQLAAIRKQALRQRIPPNSVWVG
jgi:hypothetical protein